MSNSIKYNASAESLALNTGNFWIGTGDVGKGPTSTTGFWNAINPSNINNRFADGYTIYVNKESQGPSIYVAADDAELINLTNNISGNSYTTINQCFDYFITQDDKFVLNSYINPIITDGLVLALDASLVPSYPRNGTSWGGLTSTNGQCTLNGGFTFESGEYISFDGTDGYANFTTEYQFQTGGGTDYSFEMWFKMRTLPTEQYGDNGHIWGGENGNDVVIILNPAVDGVSKGIIVYDDTRYSYPSMMTNGGFTADTWAQWVVTGNGTTNTVSHYINGVLDKADGAVPSAYAAKNWAGTGLAYDSRWVKYSTLDIKTVRQYDRQLTAEEISQNYYQSKIVTDGLVFAVDPGNLVSYENSSTTTYSLVGTNTGTLIGGVDFNGGNGGVWGFDGNNDYITVSNLGLSSHTIEGWINSSDGDQGGTSAATIVNAIGNYTGAEDGKYTMIGFSGGNVLTYRIDNGVTSFRLVANVVYTADQWYHVALSYDSGTGDTVAYLNGNDLSTINVTPTGITFDSIPLNIAKTETSGGAFFNGLVGSVRTYNRALTAAEVAQNYGAGVGRFSNTPIP